MSGRTRDSVLCGCPCTGLLVQVAGAHDVLVGQCLALAACVPALLPQLFLLNGI